MKLLYNIYNIYVTRFLISAVLSIWLGLHVQAVIEFLEEPVNTVIARGQSLQLDCHATTNLINPSTLTIQWKHNNVPLNSGGRVSIFTNGTMRIVSTQTGDEGVYGCLASLVSSAGLEEQRNSLNGTVYFAFLNPVDLITGDQIAVDKQLAPAYFQCVSGDSRPLPVITWERDGEPVNDELSYGEQFGGLASLKWSQTLQINNVRKRHEGRYRCLVTNPLLSNQVERSSYSTLTVNPNPGDPYISVQPQSQIIPLGRPAAFPCQILGDPAPSVVWGKTDEPNDIVSADERLIFPNGSLYFPAVSDAHEGSYVCTGTSRLGEVSTAPAVLTVASMGWMFTQNPSEVEVVEDMPATLICRPPVSKPPANITWYKDNQVYEPWAGSTILDVGDIYFSSVTKNDEGTYFCVATNSYIPQSVTSDSAALIVRVVASITVPPVNQDVILGNELMLTCEVTGDPTPSIIWKKDSAAVTPGIRVSIGNAGQLLHVANVIGLDQGTYTCEARNDYGLDTASVYVDVLVPPQIISGPGNQRATLQSSVSLTCETIGDPIPEVTWFKDGLRLELTPGGDPKYQVTSRSLIINELTVEDGGSYRCLAVSSAGEADSSGILTIETPPAIVTPLTNQTVHQGAVVYFTCEASGEPQPGLVWLHDDGPIPSWGSISNQGRVLTISSTSGLTRGKITCRAENRHGLVESVAYLNVRVVPVITPISDTTANLQSVFTVQCTATAFPEPTITWLRGPDVIIASDRIMLQPSGTLTIAAVTKEDQGDYSCVAANDVGSERVNFYVSVLGLPGTPSILNAAAISVDSVTVYWTVGGDPADSMYYQLQYKLSTSTMWLTFLDRIPAVTSPQSHTVSGLEESSSYRFRVSASNTISSSPQSNVVGASTPSITGPSAPRSLTVTSYNATAVSLQWEIPVKRNGPVAVYTVQYRKTGTNDYLFLELSGSNQFTIEVVITNLMPVTSYEFRVMAATLHNEQHQFGNYTEYIMQTTSPSAPSSSPGNVMVVASSSTTLLVSWSAVPPEHQNGPLQGYSISYKAMGSTTAARVEIVNQTVFSVTLTGLDKWQEYGVVVLGFNSEGEGPGSDVIVERTEADAPTQSPPNFMLSTSNQTSILATWEVIEQADRHGPIDGYLLTYWAQDSMGRQELELPASASGVILSGLEIATLYNAQLAAFNIQADRRLVGPASAVESAATQDGIPGPIESFRATEIGSYHIHLSWEPPLVTNGAILAYVITYKAGLPQDVPTDVLSVVTGVERGTSRQTRESVYVNETHGRIETSATSYNLTSLGPNTEYSIEIVAQTSAGMGVNPQRLIVSTNMALVTDSLPWKNDTSTMPVSQVPELVPYPQSSLIIFVLACGLAGLAFCLAIVVLLIWCKRRGDDKTLKQANYLINNDHMCAASQRSNSVDVTLDMSSRLNSKTPSLASSRSNSHLPSVPTPTPSPPQEFADLSSMEPGPMDPSRPRASSSPSMDHLRVHRDLPEGYTGYTVAADQGSGTVPRANGRLYTPARSPRNLKYHPAPSQLQNDNPETTPDKLDELYQKVTKSSARSPSRLKQDSLAAIAVLLDQEETNSDLQPLENPTSVVISNQRTTL